MHIAVHGVQCWYLPYLKSLKSEIAGSRRNIPKTSTIPIGTRLQSRFRKDAHCTAYSKAGRNSVIKGMAIKTIENCRRYGKRRNERTNERINERNLNNLSQY